MCIPSSWFVGSCRPSASKSVRRLRPLVACAEWQNGWALLMHDCRELFLERSQFVTRYLDTMIRATAVMNAHMLGHPALDDPARGLCEPEAYYSFWGLTDLFEISWDRLEEYCAKDTVRIVREVHEDPVPLCDALSRFEATLVHGDAKYNNLAIVSETPPAVVAVDWQMATRLPPLVELARMICSNVVLGPFEPLIDSYREAFAQRVAGTGDEQMLREPDWQAQLDLALLGSVVWHRGWTLHARGEQGRSDDLAWWEERIRAAARLL